MNRADLLRNRLRWLHSMGDACCGYECWRDTDENLLSEFAWVMDPALDRRIDWPADCVAAGVRYDPQPGDDEPLKECHS